MHNTQTYNMNFSKTSTVVHIAMSVLAIYHESALFERLHHLSKWTTAGYFAIHFNLLHAFSYKNPSLWPRVFPEPIIIITPYKKGANTWIFVCMVWSTRANDTESQPKHSGRDYMRFHKFRTEPSTCPLRSPLVHNIFTLLMVQ